MNLTLHELAHRLGGEVRGQNALVPGPGHSAGDRSLSIRIEPTAREGFIVHSFAGDPAMACRDHVRSALGLGVHGGRPDEDLSQKTSLSSGIPDHDRDRRSALALNLWEEGRDPRGSAVTIYLAGRGLVIPDDFANGVIRFHPRLKTKDGPVGGMLALFRDVQTNEPCGIHRTFLDRAGHKLGRKTLGRARGAAIKLDADEHVTLGLHIGEGFESCLAAYLAGFRPVWAAGSAGAIAAFPVVPGIETITILGEVNDGGANHRAANACANRWMDADREALFVWPEVGHDLNDVWEKINR